MLTVRQIEILRDLAVGYSYTHIAQRLKTTEACVYAHACRIRKRTGISDTKNRWECAKFLREHTEIRRHAALPTVPSPRQLLIMELFSEGKSYDYIANDLRIGKQTVINQLSAARLRAGIVSTPGSDRVKEIRDYLARRKDPFEVVTMEDPMFQ